MVVDAMAEFCRLAGNDTGVRRRVHARQVHASRRNRAFRDVIAPVPRRVL